MNLKPESAFGSPFDSSKPLPDFDRAFVTLTERSDIGCILLNSAVDTKEVVSSIADSLGFEVPVSAAIPSGHGPGAVVWLTPRSWLIPCPVSEEFGLIARINAAFPDKRVHASAFSDYLCWLEIGGKEAHTLLTSAGFLSLEIAGLKTGHAKRTLLAGIPVVVVRNGDARWTLGVERSRLVYFTGFLRDSAARERAIAGRVN
ncbi:heterotetrameric sarcosine oxidase gamma subunit [Paraburkholderia sp. UCT70]|uniref:sarcosine oxidase subunit gamma family protein n=1 Tax=Paraburkholderia sp. UCT70 TaxID=2991068 RepID=UPI003D1D8B01